MPNTHVCVYEAPTGRFEGVCDRRRRIFKDQMVAQNERNALDALKRAVLAKDHELYQFEITRAEEYIKAALADAGAAVEGRE